MKIRNPSGLGSVALTLSDPSVHVRLQRTEERASQLTTQAGLAELIEPWSQAIEDESAAAVRIARPLNADSPSDQKLLNEIARCETLRDYYLLTAVRLEGVVDRMSDELAAIPGPGLAQIWGYALLVLALSGLCAMGLSAVAFPTISAVVVHPLLAYFLGGEPDPSVSFSAGVYFSTLLATALAATVTWAAFHRKEETDQSTRLFIAAHVAFSLALMLLRGFS